MSIRVKTQPVEAITVSGASSMSVPEVEADVFRGVFHNFVYEGQPLTREVHGARPAGTLGAPISIEDNGGQNTFVVASGAGVYGDDCIALECDAIPFTTNYLTNDRLFTSVGHDLLENDKVMVLVHPNGGEAPAGLADNFEGYDAHKPHAVINVATDSFELSNREYCVPSDSAGDLLFTDAGHGLVAGNTVRFSDITTLTGVTAYTDYHVISDGLTSSTWKISDTPGGVAKAYVDHYGSPIYYRSDAGMQFTSNGTGDCVVSRTGMASFYVIQSLSDGDGTVTPLNSGNSQFFGPVSGRPYNRLEFYIKNPAGFRNWAAANVLTNNWNIGTYHAPLGHDKAEKFNYHFYYQIILRHDQADGSWIRVTVGDTPSYQRDDGRWDPGVNPTPLITDGNFLDCLTRAYFKNIYNYQHPEMYADYVTLIDRMRIFYQEPPHPITFAFDSLDTEISQGVAPIVATDIPFTITNFSGSPVSGNIRHAFTVQAHEGNLNAEILDSGMSVIGLTDTVIVPASGTWTGYLRFTPILGPRKYYQSCGVAFVPLDQLTLTGGRSPGILDPNSEMSNFNQEIDWGPLDAWRYGQAISLWKAYRIEFDGVNDKITFTDGYSVTNGTNLVLKRQSTSDTLPTGFTEFATYEVMNAGTAECQLSSDGGVTPITFTDDWSTASGFFLAY